MMKTLFYSRKIAVSMLAMLFFTCLGMTSIAQTRIAGIIKNSQNQQPLVGVSIQVKGKIMGTTTDNEGRFSLTVADPPPLTLSISSIGFSSQEVEITNAETLNLEVTLEEQYIMTDEVVISASRT